MEMLGWFKGHDVEDKLFLPMYVVLNWMSLRGRSQFVRGSTFTFNIFDLDIYIRCANAACYHKMLKWDCTVKYGSIILL